MKLTFIIPLYNREDYIETAIESLLRQQDSCDLDILVVNDGSNDRGPERVASMAETHGCIRMVTTDNQGVTRARNTGLHHVSADSEFVSFLDSDDVSPSGRIEKDLAAFHDDPELQFTYGRMTLTNQMDDLRFEPCESSKQVTVRGLSMSAGIYRSSLIKQIGQFDESFEQCEDTDYLFRLFEQTSRFRLTDTICVYYRRHPGNMTRDKEVAKRSFMRAVHKMVSRRKANPALALPSAIFDFKELMENPME